MGRKKTVTLVEVKDFLGVDESNVTARVNVTPMMAKWVVDHCNRGNRRVKMDYVQTLRRDMESGNWYSDVDYIGFDKNGTLVNGQHRLKALAGAEIDYVTLKFDFDVQQHLSMDTGNNRTYVDHVKMLSKNGVDAMPVKFKAIVLAGLRWTHPKLKPSNTELTELWHIMKESLEMCDSMGIFELGKVPFATVKASLLWSVMSGVDSETVSHIAYVLRTGMAEHDVDVPVIRLRDALLVDIKGNGNISEMRRAQYTQQCVYNVLAGSTTNRLPSNPVMHYANYDPLQGRQ